MYTLHEKVRKNMLEICDEKEKSSLYFSVQDDGIGIEEEKQKLIFSSKTKALMFGGNEMSFLIDIQGTGKCIIESLGGQLMVSSL